MNVELILGFLNNILLSLKAVLLCQEFDWEFHLENPPSHTNKQETEDVESFKVLCFFQVRESLQKEQLSKIYSEVVQTSFFIFSLPLWVVPCACEKKLCAIKTKLWTVRNLRAVTVNENLHLLVLLFLLFVKRSRLLSEISLNVPRSASLTMVYQYKDFTVCFKI